MKIVNANWTAGANGQDGQFECLIITDDDERHVVTVTAPEMTALVALARADTVLLWDPPVRTLIVANIVGRMPWTERAPRSLNDGHRQAGGGSPRDTTPAPARPLQ